MALNAMIALTKQLQHIMDSVGRFLNDKCCLLDLNFTFYCTFFRMIMTMASQFYSSFDTNGYCIVQSKQNSSSKRNLIQFSFCSNKIILSPNHLALDECFMGWW